MPMQMNNASYRFSLSIAITISLLCYSFIASHWQNYFLHDPDTFWHIRTGEWILDNARVPTVDLFSYTAAGKPWIATEWLSEIIFAIAFKFGGWRAVIILTAMSCAAIVGILCFYLVRCLRFSVAIGCAALTAALISAHFLARPHVFSYILLIVWTIILLDTYDDENSNIPPALTLAPLMVLWANLHGSFTFGLALLYVFVGFSLYENIIRRNYTKCRQILVVVFIVTLCAMMTPYGISSAFMTAKLLEMKYTIAHVVELRSPDFQEYKFHLIFLVAILLAIAGLGIRLRGPRLIVFGIIAFGGLSYLRGLIMFFLLAPIILARPASACAWYLAPQLSDRQSLETDKASDGVLRYLQKRLLAVPAISMALAALVTVSIWWQADVSPSKTIAPQAAIDFVRHANITGNVFNSYGFGGFLIFSGIPTFVDGRALPFGDAFFYEYNNAINFADPDRAFQLLDNYKITWIILNPTAPLAKAIARSAFWDRVYSDQYSVIFTRHQQ
jgi:hypothetical protein